MGRSRIADWLCPYGSRRRVMRGPARGFHVIVGPGLGVTYLLGHPEAAPPFFADVIGNGMTVIDVGANKGQMTLLFAALVGGRGRVVSLEPAAEEFAALEQNVRLNSLTNVELILAAAAEQSADREFTYSADSPTQGKLVDAEPSYRIDGALLRSVRTIALDSLLQRGIEPDVIKIDVEGAAESVLRGASRMLDCCRPAVYIELHGPEEQIAVRDQLLAREYVVETLDGRRVSDPTAAWFSPLWCYSGAAAAGVTAQ